MVKEYFLSEKCIVLCTCAESTLTSVCDKIGDGSVTPSELFLMEKKKNHILKLISSMTKGKDIEKNLEKSLSIRFEEHKKFCEQKERLDLLCNRVIKVKGMAI